MNTRTSGQQHAGRRRLLPFVLALLAGYLVVGNVLHRLVFPMPPPDPTTFPRPGDVLESRSEGFEQHVLSIVDDNVVSRLIVHPGAEGPPLHYHEGFAETFPVLSGTLYIELADGVITVPAGESFRVPPGVAHRPFNPGTEPAIVASEHPLLPLDFAACLVQLYSLMDERGNGPHMLLQLAVNDPICDTHLADLPGGTEPLLATVAGPVARLLGYRNYDPDRSLHPPGRPAADHAMR